MNSSAISLKVNTREKDLKTGSISEGKLNRKKTLSREEKEKNIFMDRALLDNRKQVDIFLEDKGLASKQLGISVAKESEKLKERLKKRKKLEEREKLAKTFEKRGYYCQAKNLRECQTKWIYYECKGCGSVGWVKNRCGLRVCPDCAGRMKIRLLKKYERGIKRLNNFYKQRLKLLTLTIKNVPDLKAPDFDAISSLKESFYRLRKRPRLRNKIYGGVYGLETTFRDNGWHVHIHALVSSEYIRDACSRMKKAKNREEEKEIENSYCSRCKSKCLRRFWQETTGSSVVDVRKANTKAINEIIGYITKPFSTNDPELLVDWWQAMKNRPFLKPFGCFYDMRKIRVALTCPFCGCNRFKVYYGDRIRLCDLRGANQVRGSPFYIDIEGFSDPVFIDPGKIVISHDDRGFEHKTLYLENNFELRVGKCEE